MLKRVVLIVCILLLSSITFAQSACLSNNDCSGICWKGKCAIAAKMGEACDANTVCVEGGCDVNSGKCAPFVIPLLSVSSHADDLAIVGEEFPLLTEKYAWVNMFQEGNFDFSLIIKNGKIIEKKEEPVKFATHNLYFTGKKFTKVDVVSLRGIFAGLTFITAPLQPMLQSNVIGAEMAGVDISLDQESVLDKYLAFYSKAFFSFENIWKISEVTARLELKGVKSAEGVKLTVTLYAQGPVDLDGASTKLKVGDISDILLELHKEGDEFVGSFEVDLPGDGEYRLDADTISLLGLEIPISLNGLIIISGDTIRFETDFGVFS